MRRDGQTETSASILAGGGGVGLGKGREDSILFGKRHSDTGILHPAVFCELQGIIHQIDQDLHQSGRITDQDFRDLGRQTGGYDDVIFFGLDRHQGGEFIELVFQ